MLLDNPFTGLTILPTGNTNKTKWNADTAIIKEKRKGMIDTFPDGLGRYYTQRIKDKIEPEEIAEALKKLVAAGNIKAIELILNRIEPVAQKLEVTNVSNPLVEGLKELLAKDEIKVVKDMTNET